MKKGLGFESGGKVFWHCPFSDRSVESYLFPPALLQTLCSKAIYLKVPKAGEEEVLGHGGVLYLTVPEAGEEVVLGHGGVHHELHLPSVHL